MTELDRTLELYRAISSRIPRAITNSATFQDGYPTGGSAGGSGPADHRTAETAVLHAYGREVVEDGVPTGRMTGAHDPHGADRKALEATIQRLADLVDRLAPSNRAADHLATQASNACPPGCCESCFRDGGHRTPTRTEGSKLCRWCEDMARDVKAPMPPLMLVAQHNRGQRITDRDVRMATGGRS